MQPPAAFRCGQKPSTGYSAEFWRSWRSRRATVSDGHARDVSLVAEIDCASCGRGCHVMTHRSRLREAARFAGLDGCYRGGREQDEQFRIDASLGLRWRVDKSCREAWDNIFHTHRSRFNYRPLGPVRILRGVSTQDCLLFCSLTSRARFAAAMRLSPSTSLPHSAFPSLSTSPAHPPTPIFYPRLPPSVRRLRPLRPPVPRRATPCLASPRGPCA